MGRIAINILLVKRQVLCALRIVVYQNIANMILIVCRDLSVIEGTVYLLRAIIQILMILRNQITQKNVMKN